MRDDKQTECATCGEPIPDGEAEFDLDGGRIGLPHHPICLSMPESLKAKIVRCPACGHMAGRHLEVTAFDYRTGKIRVQPSPCSCGCDLLPNFERRSGQS